MIPRLAGDDGDVPYCNTCQNYWFDGFASCVIILVANEFHEMAVLKQSYISDEHWTFVAGFIKPGETAEECAIREVKEEIGIDIERLEYGGTLWFGKRDQLMHGFIGFCRKKDFEISSEVKEAAWIPASEAVKWMFPERPDNMQHPLYFKYLEMIESNREKKGN